MVEKSVIGARIREFGEKNFPSIAEFSRALGMKNPAQIHDYLRGKSFPGFELLSQLHRLGCDIVWLITGQKSDDSSPDISMEARTSRLISFVNEKGWSKAEIAEKLEIDPRYVEKYLNGEMSVYDLAGGLHHVGCDVVWMLTGVSFKNISKLKGALNRLEKLEEENEAFRKALSPEMVELILKKGKKGK